jgi:hypothetical protein
MPSEKRFIVSCSYVAKRQVHTVQETMLGRLLPTLEQAAGIPAIGLAPFHRNFPSFPARVITTIDPTYRGVPIPMDVLQDRVDHRWFYLLARDDDVCARLDEPPFFNGRPDDLYRVSDRGEAENAHLLLRDVLLFGSAVREAVRLLVGDIPCTWLLHEWQGAACILGNSRNGRDPFYLLLRSSYDSEAVAPKLLLDFGIDPDACPGPGDCPTILERARRLLPRAPGQQRHDNAPDERPNPQETHAGLDRVGSTFQPSSFQGRRTALMHIARKALS